MHDVLSETIEQELKAASTGFITKIRTHTQNISTELFERLGITSNLQIPADLSVLFEVLDFETTKHTKNVSLRYRGDGIKTRHIPVILKFISEQRNINRQKGAIKSSPIWGYEEPENNLELSKAFEQARDFVEYSETIQMLITTHSPAFYSIRSHNSTASIFIVRPDAQNQNASTIQPFDGENLSTLDDEMGLLPLITPHLQQLLIEKEELLSQVKAKETLIQKYNSPMLFVEGPTDKNIIEKAIEIFAPHLRGNFQIAHGGGYNWVADMTLSWYYSRKSTMAVSLFDWDDGGRTGRKRIEDVVREGNRNFKLLNLPKAPHLRKIFGKGISLAFSMEDLFPTQIMRHAKSKGWLKFKSEVMRSTSYNDPDRTFSEYCEQTLGLSPDDQLYLYKIKEENKLDFCRYVTSLQRDDLEAAFKPLEYLVTGLAEKFNLAIK